MDSREIAKLCGKDHANVLKDIRRVLGEAEIGLVRFHASYFNSQNKEQPCYQLPKFECDLVVSGYSVPYRAAIIRRWHELEAKEQVHNPPEHQLPQTLGDALRFAAELSDKTIEQAAQLETQQHLLETQQPAVEVQQLEVSGSYSKRTWTHPTLRDQTLQDIARP